MFNPTSSGAAIAGASITNFMSGFCLWDMQVAVHMTSLTELFHKCVTDIEGRLKH